MQIRGRYDTRDVFLAKINWILILVAQDTFFLLNPLVVSSGKILTHQNQLLTILLLIKYPICQTDTLTSYKGTSVWK